MYGSRIKSVRTNDKRGILHNNRDIVKKNNTLPEKIHFKIEAALGFPVQTTAGYWKIITTVKHPSIIRKEGEVKNCLRDPDEIRTSKKDRNVYLFYSLGNYKFPRLLKIPFLAAKK